MPVIIRAGGRIRFEKSGPGDGPRPPDKKPCESCGKPEHPFAPEWGSHIGNSMWLSDAILQGQEPEAHPWYTGRWSIAAHHLICSEAMADDEDWAKICRQYGYNINGRKNGAIFPSRMEVACELHVPVHRGNHAAGWAHDIQMAYPKAVMARTDDIKALVIRGAFCSDPSALTRELDALSEEILAKLASFQWTLSVDGLDYREGGNGCAGTASISDKPTRACPRRRAHALKHGATGKPLERRALRVGE
ncbi:AHH domain-containing protein [Pyxidicoccus parkwayensis]|uniref:AHH domain-containing protein n=1 Tax=Pyxidicoccus parkwayensis TaxID=2813578 RepID=A0ABX7NVS9_9BACT|nr:AHH domain-containing protein [Pyxidicoccus parkwaysis]QSQ22910.1 AHH domain-containing protein [Pyxidicoccus parkwaysis]